MNCSFKISCHLNTINQISTQKSVLRSREIDQQLIQDQELRKKEIQILVLGNRNAGKTTFLKQFRIHYGDGYPYIQRAILIQDILSNLADAIHIVMDNMARWDLRFEDPYVQTLAKDFHNNCPRSSALSYNQFSFTRPIPNSPPTPFSRFRKTTNRISDFCLHIKNISDQDDFQECLDCKEFFKPCITYSDLYFIQNIDRIIQTDYIPTLQDILVMRKPTYNVKDCIFNLGGITLRFIDLGGYRCQRNKFIHYFEGVSTVFYFCAISEYSEIIEDTTKNKLESSLENFQEIINNKYLWRKDFIIFLNKLDLFKAKVENLSINVFFHDYEGNPSDVEDGINFFRLKFLNLKPANAPKSKKLYTHVTCSLDIDKMKVIIKQMIQSMLDTNVKRMTLF